MKRLLILLLFILCFPALSNAAIVLIGTDGKAQMCLSHTEIAVQAGSTSSSIINCTLVDAILAIEETATVTNVVARNTRGNDIDLTAAKVLTITYSLYAYSETTGDTPGTGCLDGGSVDPILDTLYRPALPAVNAGGTDVWAGVDQTDIYDMSIDVSVSVPMGCATFPSSGGSMSLGLGLEL